MPETKELQTEAEIRKHLSDRWWRLNNLYRVVNEAGVDVLFKPNWFQTFLYKHLWYLSVILKARQVGVTTFLCILWLDDCLFTRNLSAAIIADNKTHAEEIFEKKVKFAFEHLPPWLKSSYQVDTDSAKKLKFNNGSSIQVATSVRSATIQRLHISEFGKICAKYPDKAQEIISGSLNTVHTGQLITIESTAEGAYGKFYDICKDSMDFEALGKKLTPLDFKFFFFPWWKVPHYTIDADVTITKEMVEYFEMLSSKHGIELTEGQKAWYIKKLKTQKENMKREFPSFAEEAFEAAVEGAYYGKEVDVMYKQKRITVVPHDPLLKVDTYWDLGVNDTMVILFIQQYGGQIRIIDIYRNSGEGLKHYAGILADKRDKLNYNYGGHYAPHDIQVKEMGTGKTRLETASKLGIRFKVLPKLSLSDGIDAVRMVLPRVWIDEINCEPVIKALSLYRKEWNDKLGVWSSNPFHDEHSHIADAFRYMAIGVKPFMKNFIKGENDWHEPDDPGFDDPMDKYNVL